MVNDEVIACIITPDKTQSLPGLVNQIHEPKRKHAHFYTFPNFIPSFTI